LSLPEAVERPFRTQPTFRIRDKIFAALSEDETAMGFKVSKDERAELIAAEPEKFFFIDGHDNKYDWARVRLDTVDADEVAELITEAWRRTAPKRLAASYHPGSR
jgi:hypothetical protein